ncbi:T9SS type A sorting domain-containing protein, partial [Dolichospermum sp. ST_sed3]|nr:T9SS type A sorting domain-containing protein [Dolichospermum sp. ST_sed3]
NTVVNSTKSIITDNIGNIYLSGYFDGITDFDPEIGVANLTSHGNLDIFFAKYDSLGNYLWARNIGGFYEDRGNAIAIDNSNSVYLSGFFSGSMDADPGSGIATLSPANSENIFISKYSDTFTSVNQLNGSDFSIISVYPNPAIEVIKISGYSSIRNASIKIMDCYGKPIICSIYDNNQIINVSHLPAGLYIIEVTDSGGPRRAKFIKN